MPIVEIKGVGKAQFPDDMPINDIRNFLRNKYSQRAMQGQSDLLSPAPQTIEAYEPTLSEKMGQGVSDALYDAGIVSDRYGAQRIGSNVTALGEMLPGIGDATAGDDFGRALSQGNYGDAAIAGVGTIPVIGDMAIFAGALAKNANLGALKEAKALELQGKDRDEIWQETGWFNDKGDWKFEIDDSNYSLDPSKPKESEFGFKTSKGEVIRHSNLKDAHPSILGENMTVSFEPNLSSQGSYRSISESKLLGDPESHFIRVKDPAKPVGNVSGQIKQWADKVTEWSKPGYAENYAKEFDLPLDEAKKEIADDTSWIIGKMKEAREKDSSKIEFYKGTESTALHELQHAVQNIEGFERGGSPGKGVIEAAKEQINKNLAPIKESINKIEGSDKYRNRIDELIGQGYRKRGARIVADKEFGLDELNKEWLKTSPIEKAVYNKQSQNYDSYAAYKRLAGEAEARLVQKRMNMTPEERRAKPPWLDLDVPEDELIYRK
jgi:hypothetical protein